MKGDFSVPGYEVEGLLGAGATGEAWLARSSTSREQVVLKRVPADGNETHESARRLASTLAELGHPHILGLRDLVADEGEVVFVTDYAESGSLAQLLLARVTLDPGEVVTTIGPVAEALAAAHGSGVLHGDLTPESICYAEQGLPLLADLGLLGLGEFDAGTVGTHGFVDPLAPGEARLNPAGDVYSLAAVCYAMLTGDPPPPPHERRPLHELAPGVPPGLAHAVEAGLQGDPSRRPTAGQFAELLYNACQPTPVRFPLGLVITSDDLGGASSDPFGQAAAAGSAAATGPPQQPEAPASGGGGEARPDPSGHGSGAPGAPDQPPPVLGTGAPAGAWRADEDDDDDGERRRRPALVALLVAVPLLIVGLIVGGLVWLGPNLGSTAPNGGPEPGPPTGEPTEEVDGPTLEDLDIEEPNPPSDPERRRWWDVLTELDEKRAEAFAQADVDLLSNVYTEDALVLRGDQVEANDRLRIEAFAEQGATAEGARFYIAEIDVESASEDRVVLRVVDYFQPHIIVRANGEREAVEAGPPTPRIITLHRVGEDAWRIYNIQPASGGG